VSKKDHKADAFGSLYVLSSPPSLPPSLPSYLSRTYSIFNVRSRHKTPSTKRSWKRPRNSSTICK